MNNSFGDQEDLKIEDYKIGDKIDSGTYGEVYKIFKEGWDTPLAVKKFKKIYKSKDEAEEEIEVKFYRKVQHPYIIQLENIIFEDSQLYIIMELGSMNLFEKIKERKDDA